MFLVLFYEALAKSFCCPRRSGGVDPTSLSAGVYHGPKRAIDSTYFPSYSDLDMAWKRVVSATEFARSKICPHVDSFPVRGPTMKVGENKDTRHAFVADAAGRSGGKRYPKASNRGR